MTIVLDASVTMAWCFADESTPFTDGVLNDLPSSSAVVPAIWPLEVANVLLVAERRQRITRGQADAFAQELVRLPINVRPLPLTEAVGVLLDAARSMGLSAYDASYLVLALGEGLPLATQDARLRNAAAQLGVALVA